MSDYTGRKTFTIYENDAGSEAYRDEYVLHLEQQLAAAQARARELEEVVGRLPKDADGDPLMPNTPYYFIDHGEMRHGYYTISANKFRDGRLEGLECFAPNCPKSYFKTRAAAEAAKGGAG